MILKMCAEHSEECILKRAASFLRTPCRSLYSICICLYLFIESKAPRGLPAGPSICLGQIVFRLLRGFREPASRGRYLFSDCALGLRLGNDFDFRVGKIRLSPRISKGEAKKASDDEAFVGLVLIMSAGM
jgi:hypothetical protein